MIYFGWIHLILVGSKTPKIPPFHCVSEANALATGDVLSMVTWYHQNIVKRLWEKKQDSQNTTFPLREQSERVVLSACVKHGHVVQSKFCKWLPFDYVRPSIQTQTLVAYSLHDELPNCQCHFSSLSFAHALWPLVCCIHFSGC